MKKCTLILVLLSFGFNLVLKAEDVYRYHPTSTHLTSLFDLDKRVQAADNYALHIWTNLLNHDPEIGLMTFFLVEKIYTHKIYNSDEFFAYLDKSNKKPTA
ncbi:MAG: hypothetical protein JNM93_13465, partial [Bacteriovoracaceae bacterium]|nr:hypothetical protein [Bacteriovoracaceae bacterium]